MILPESIIAEIIADGYCTDVIRQFEEYCRVCQDTFHNYDEEDTPWHLWEAYDACIYPYKVDVVGGHVLLRFAQNGKDLENDVLEEEQWQDYDEWPIFEHPSFGGKQ